MSEKYYDVIFQDRAQLMREKLMAPVHFVNIKTAQVMGAQPGPVAQTGSPAPAGGEVPQPNQQIPQPQPQPQAQPMDQRALLEQTITDLEKSPIVELFLRQAQPITPGPASQEAGAMGAQQGNQVQQPGQSAQAQPATSTPSAPMTKTAGEGLKKLRVKKPKVPKAPTGAPSAKQTVTSYESPQVSAPWKAPDKVQKAIRTVREKLPRAGSKVSLKAEQQKPYNPRKGSQEE